MNSIQKKLPFLFSLFSVMIFVLISCTPSTETSKGSLNGTINLEGEIEHSEITIALYDLAILDPTIVSINQEYPQIGVQISQHTEFDHRLHSPVKSIETEADGSFELKKISTGRYNLVVIKDGWGFKYLYNIEISKGDNDLNQQVNLYEEIHISGNIQGSITVETDHHLIIDDDAVFLPNTSSLNIQPGAVIRINPGVDLTIHGAITAQGEENNMFWVTSNDGFSQNTIANTINQDDISIYNSLKFSSPSSVSNNLIEWGKLDYGSTTLLIENQDDLTIKNLIFRGQNSGLHITYSNNNQVKNIIGQNSTNDSNASVYFSNSSNHEVIQSIILNNEVGIKIHTSIDASVKQNYITYCQTGVRNMILSSNTLIENNDFSQLETAIENIGRSTIHIFYNNINANIGLGNYKDESHFYYAVPYINNNNLYCTEYAMKNSSFFIEQTYFDAKNNWWNTTDEEEIRALIWDRDDEDPNSPYYHLLIASFEYSPYQILKVQNAGIN